MDRSFILMFRPKQASIHLGVNAEGARTRSISLVIALESGEDVHTVDKRSLRSVQWTMQLLDMDHFNEAATKEGAIGFLSYLPESNSEYDFSPESCHASVAVGQRTFNSLFDVLITGRLPDSLSVSVKGMRYGRHPDGREKIWDTQANQDLPIVEISVRVPIAARSSERD